MPCSAVTLSLATISAVIAVSLLGIAFGTDNWTYVNVDRNKVKVFIGQQDSLGEQALADYGSSPLYFTRTVGLFRTCFPFDKPQGVELYLSPVETYCSNVNYYIPDETKLLKTFSDEKEAVIHMMRSLVALFILSFIFIFVAFWTGVVGCWRRNSGNITATAVLMLLACLFSAGAMGLFHGVEYYEMERLNEEPYYKKWPEFLKRDGVTSLSYDWSYMVSWVGIGAALISSFLFFGAARCLQYEKDRDQAHKMQYLMPVYPQKQQYPYPYAYPGPYAYHGSQYGPYNY